MLPNIIETKRLRLRPIGFQDVEALLSYTTDPEWARYLPIPQPYTTEHAEQFIANQVLLDRERHPAWAIALDGLPRNPVYKVFLRL
jgi:RimJ/RimL family protein N-acetyltransferase